MRPNVDWNEKGHQLIAKGFLSWYKAGAVPVGGDLGAGAS